MTVLKRIVIKEIERDVVHLCGSGWGPMAGFCENDNKHSGSIKARNVLTTQLSASRETL
jgi:hypothetical protein